MTITYQYRVANASLGTFVKLLAVWRGSIYKLMYKEMIIFCTCYATISLIYRLALDQAQKAIFENVVQYCNSYTSLIPISFVLGFYVSLIVHRWWTQFQNVPWPDRTLFMTCCYLHGTEEKSKIMRRTIARYMMFGLILICRSISVAVMKRFPTLDHIVESGFISREEAEMYENVECKYNRFWVPIMWANSVLVQARRENKIESDWGLRMIIEQLADFRDKCSTMFVYDWITIPLVYTQVVTLSVYTFFGACIVGRQFLDPSKRYPGYDYDLYVPLFTLLQFFFYMGWLKVAEQLINPFGEDDDDFDINWLLDRHMAVAMTLVDQMYGKYPPLLKDIHFNEVVEELPYTEASLSSKRPIFLGSTYNLAVPSVHDQRIVPPEEMHTVDNHRRRTPSYGSHFAGSVISLITGRSSNYSKSYNHRSHEHLHHHGNHMDTLMHHVPNGHADYLQDRHFSTDTNNTKFSNDYSVWSSDNDIGPNHEFDHFRGRERSKTDADERLLNTEEKKHKHRKISFPLSLIRKLTSSSHHQKRASAETLKASDSEHDNDSIPEYVPLRRAKIKPEVKRKDSKNTDRKRKVSYPLSIIKKPLTDEDSGSTHSVPGAITAKSKSSRFTVQQVPNTLNVEDTSIHWRNAQKIEKAMVGKVVSRAPELSAIEEGNTVTSITQVLPSDDEDDVFLSKPVNELAAEPIIEANECEKDDILEHSEEQRHFDIPTIIIEEC